MRSCLYPTTIKTTAATRVEDKSSTQLKKFNLSDVRTGDFLKIAGYNSSNGFIATQIERQDLKGWDVLKIEGLVTAVSTDNFSINERTILIDDKTKIRDQDGEDLTKSAFLMKALGQPVEVRGTLVDGKFTATRIEIKDK